MSNIRDMIGLLEKAANQFRYYEQNHRAKAQWDGLFAPERDRALEKARVNGEFAQEIEDFLNAL